MVEDERKYCAVKYRIKKVQTRRQICRCMGYEEIDLYWTILIMLSKLSVRAVLEEKKRSLVQFLCSMAILAIFVQSDAFVQDKIR